MNTPLRMHTQELIAFLEARGDRNPAYAYATERLPGWERRFRTAARQLQKLLDEARKEFPDARYYTASGGLHLVLGETHSGTVRLSPNTILSAFSASDIIQIGDGDW